MMVLYQVISITLLCGLLVAFLMAGRLVALGIGIRRREEEAVRGPQPRKIYGVFVRIRR